MKDAEIEDYVKEQSELLCIPIPEIILSKQFTYSLGEACLLRNVIKLNRTYIHKTTDIFARSIILHEMIHLKNWIENKSYRHDKNFRQMCKKYGCHTMSAFTVKEKKKVKSYHITDGSTGYVKGDVPDSNKVPDNRKPHKNEVD